MINDNMIKFNFLKRSLFASDILAIETVFFFFIVSIKVSDIYLCVSLFFTTANGCQWKFCYLLKADYMAETHLFVSIFNVKLRNEYFIKKNELKFEFRENYALPPN